MLEQRRSQNQKPARGNLGQSAKNFNKPFDRAAISEQLDNELNIQEELRDIIEDNEDDLPLNFKDPSELMEIFQQLEENNLIEIERM